MKANLRRTAIAKRDAILAADHEAWSFAACEQLVLAISERGLMAKSIALYNPIKSELDVTPVLHALDAEGGNVSLPVVESGRSELSFYRFHSTLHMEEGAFGVLEPERLEQVTPDVVVVPLVAFDAAGNRLGYGKGYYDATLHALRAANPSVLAIGVGFALQEVEAIPADAHDAKLDMIVTETTMREINKR